MTEREGVTAQAATLLCEVCKKVTKTRCQKCRAFIVCSKECFEVGWPNHKAECKQLRKARKLCEIFGYVPPRPDGTEGIVAALSYEDSIKFDQEASKIYRKYDVEEPPGKDSSMPPKKKVKLFIELLQLYDSGSEQNESLPLPLRLLYNRRYNNTYRHAVENFKTRELTMLHNEMMRLEIGNGFRSGFLV